jgi:hypothetical protein
VCEVKVDDVIGVSAWKGGDREKNREVVGRSRYPIEILSNVQRENKIA